MLNAIANTLEHQRRDILAIARAIPDEPCDRLLAGLPYSPCWIVGHLCLADRLQTGSLIGGRREATEDGHFEEFGPGSDISQARANMTARFGSWSAAIDAAAATHTDLLKALRAADPDRLSKPHPIEPVRAYFPTLADNMAYAVWHEGHHGGQLRAWIHAARHEDAI